MSCFRLVQFVVFIFWCRTSAGNAATEQPQVTAGLQQTAFKDLIFTDGLLWTNGRVCWSRVQCAALCFQDPQCALFTVTYVTALNGRCTECRGHNEMPTVSETRPGSRLYSLSRSVAPARINATDQSFTAQVQSSTSLASTESLTSSYSVNPVSLSTAEGLFNILTPDSAVVNHTGAPSASIKPTTTQHLLTTESVRDVSVPSDDSTAPWTVKEVTTEAETMIGESLTPELETTRESILPDWSTAGDIETNFLLTDRPTTGDIETTSLLTDRLTTWDIETTSLLTDRSTTGDIETTSLLTDRPNTVDIETTSLLTSVAPYSSATFTTATVTKSVVTAATATASTGSFPALPASMAPSVVSGNAQETTMTLSTTFRAVQTTAAATSVTSTALQTSSQRMANLTLNITPLPSSTSNVLSTWLHTPCTSNTTCRTWDSIAVCISGKCVCAPGDSFIVSSLSCGSPCSGKKLKGDFVEYTGYQLTGAGNAPTTASTLQACQSLCIGDQSCVSINYAASLAECTLNTTAYGGKVPGVGWAQNATYTHYARHCA